MRWLAAILVLLSCAPPGTEEREGRVVVSLDFCADLYALRFVPREEIGALSPSATSDYAFLRAEAEGLPQIRPETEHVLLSGATHVIRSYGGDARLLDHLTRAGIEIIEIGYPQSLADIRDNEVRIADALNAEGFLTDESPRAAKEKGSALYLTPSGVTTGPGSLVHEVIREGGYANYEERPGWHAIPLERLMREKPDHIVTGFFDNDERFEGWWGALRHPLAQALIDDLPRTDLPGALLACPAWPMEKAAARLRDAP